MKKCMMCYLSMTRSLSKLTDAMVAELMESIYEITEDESEAVSGGIFDIISEARRDGCVIGAKHAVKLIFSLLSN